MQSWRERPVEESALFNPAFCGELIFRAVADYSTHRAAGLQLPLAFAILPFVLHGASRTALPARSDATFGTWAVKNNGLLAEFPGRVMQLRPVSREALMFMLQHGAMALTSDRLKVGDFPLKTNARIARTVETTEMVRSAALLGRWFAAQPSTTQVLQTIGLRP